MHEERLRSLVDWLCLAGVLSCEAASLITMDYGWLIFACGFAAAFLVFEGWLAVTGTTSRQ